LITFVVDASVALKWCLPGEAEDLIFEAKELLDSFARQEVDFIVPGLFWVEIGNALWKLCRRNRLSRTSAASALTMLNTLEIPTIASPRLVPHALELASQYDRTVYDSLYVALAIESSIELITADERLANAVAAYLPVKWLGTI